MQPTTVKCDLPLTHDVTTYLHNQFSTHLEELKNSFEVCSTHVKITYLTVVKAVPGKISITADGWTADMMKVGFLGVMAHWIDVREKKWELKVSVIGLKGIVSTHKGDNLGRYILGICDHVRIMGKEHSKVSVMAVTCSDSNVDTLTLN